MKGSLVAPEGLAVEQFRHPPTHHSMMLRISMLPVFEISVPVYRLTPHGDSQPSPIARKRPTQLSMTDKGGLAFRQDT